MQLIYTLLATLLLVLPSFARAACTDGTDCYSDCAEGDGNNANNFNSSCVSATCDPAAATCYEAAACCTMNTVGVPIDPNVLMTEDFDADALLDFGTSRDGDGSPTWGHWYSNNPPIAGQTNFRGFTSWWSQNYGLPNGTCNIQEGTPASPTEGATCSTSTGNNCSAAEWSANDEYQMTTEGNNPCIDIFADGDFNAETADNGAAQGDPDTPGTNDNRGHWQGNASLALRVAAGASNSMGVATGLNPVDFGFVEPKTFFDSPKNDIGFTQMVAYSDNIIASGVWDFPWKHTEWFETFLTDSNPPKGNFWPLGNTGSEPYGGFLWAQNSDQVVAGATCVVPASNCLNADPPGITGLITFNTANFAQATDWEWGDWGCARTEILGMSSGSTTLKVWHNDVLIHHSVVDGTLLNNQGFTGLVYNAYANANQVVGGETPTTQTVRRGHDNIHITNGPSVTCAQIGLSGVAPVQATLDSSGGGEAPLTGVQLTTNVSNATGPWLRYSYDCNNDATLESGPTITQDNPHLPASSICDSIFVSGATYTASVLVEDCGITSDCSSISGSDTGTTEIIVLPSSVVPGTIPGTVPLGVTISDSGAE